jgi:hypothetical protein
VLIAGALVLALIVGGALLVVLAATRERTKPVRLPRPLRLGARHRDEAADPENGDPGG